MDRVIDSGRRFVELSWDWIGSHPYITGGIVFVLVVLYAVAIRILNRKDPMLSEAEEEIERLKEQEKGKYTGLRRLK